MAEQWKKVTMFLLSVKNTHSPTKVNPVGKDQSIFHKDMGSPMSM